MRVERVEREKKKVFVTVEGVRYALHPLVWAQEAVFEGESIDLEDMLIKSEKEWSLEAAVRYASNALRTRAQVARYLRQKEWNPSEELLDKLEEWGLINDEEYAKNYAKSLAHKNGPFYIRAKLIEKGIPKEILQGVEIREDPTVMEEILLKKYDQWTDVDLREALKRKNFLVNRGFSFEMSGKAVESLRKRSK